MERHERRKENEKDDKTVECCEAARPRGCLLQLQIAYEWPQSLHVCLDAEFAPPPTLRTSTNHIEPLKAKTKATTKNVDRGLLKVAAFFRGGRTSLDVDVCATEHYIGA